MEEEKKKRQALNNAKAITLIALIITIIVMLVLVGVTISIVINSNLLKRAQEAGQATKEAYEEEGSISNITIGEKTYNSIDEYLEEKGLEVGGSGGGTLPEIEEGTKATDKSEYTDDNGDTAVIPEGFVVSGKEDEKTIEEGLVIYLIQDKTEEEIEAIDWENDTTLQTIYDQFVWIPIKNTPSETEQDINDMYICQGKTAENGDCNISLDSNGEAICTTTGHETDNKNKLMAGRLYAAGVGVKIDFSILSTSQIYQESSGIREPATRTGSDGTEYDADSTYLGYISGILGTTGYDTAENFKTSLQNEYNKIVKSVYENQGFYIGRYETSNIKGTDGTAVQVRAGIVPSTNLNWYLMYAQQVDYAINNGITNAVGSSMIQGAAYDQVMFFVNGALDGRGTTFNVTSSYSLRHKGGSSPVNTGANLYDKVKNIYDLEGNAEAWTTEVWRYDYRVHHGGSYGASSASGTRAITSTRGISYRKVGRHWYDHPTVRKIKVYI